MTQALVLTAAELAFLLASGVDPADPPNLADSDQPEPATVVGAVAMHARLGITQDEQTTAVLEAGLASLLVRGLAEVDQQQVLLNPIVAGVAESLTQPQLWAQLSLAADELADTCLLVRTATAQFLVAPRAHRCFEIAGLDHDQPYTQPLLTIARSFLETYPPAMASIIVQTADRVTIADPPRSFVLATDADGQWSLGTDPTEPDDPQSGDIVESLTADETIDRLRSVLADLEPDPEPSDE